MIYEAVNVDAPIRQGDIFHHIPRVDLSLSNIAVVDEEGQRCVAWRDLLEEQGERAAVAAVLPIRSVDAIVITQNCDAIRGEYVCLCQIDEFLPVLGGAEPKNPKKWQSLIRQHSKSNLRWFYLPADPTAALKQRMAADFRVVIRVPRAELETMRDLRVARLNEVATEHFRETLAQFLRRYPYNEWYPFTKQEFQTYAEDSPEPVKPYPWQE